MSGFWSVGGSKPNLAGESYFFEGGTFQSGGGVDHFYSGGKNTADVLNGKLYVYDRASLAASGDLEPLINLGYPLASPLEVSQAIDPNGPGNGEGGSDLANVALGVSFIAGGYGLTNALGTTVTSSLASGNVAPELAWGALDAGPAAIAVDSQAAGLYQAANAARVAGTAGSVIGGLKDAATLISAGGTLAKVFGSTASTAQIAPQRPVSVTVIPAFANPVQPASLASSSSSAPDADPAATASSSSGFALTTTQQVLAGVVVAAGLALAFHRKG